MAGRVMMRVEKSKRSRLTLRRLCTSSSSSATRIRSWSWPPRTLCGGTGLRGQAAGKPPRAAVPTVPDRAPRTPVQGAAAAHLLHRAAHHRVQLLRPLQVAGLRALRHTGSASATGGLRGHAAAGQAPHWHPDRGGPRLPPRLVRSNAPRLLPGPGNTMGTGPGGTPRHQGQPVSPTAPRPDALHRDAVCLLLDSVWARRPWPAAGCSAEPDVGLPAGGPCTETPRAWGTDGQPLEAPGVGASGMSTTCYSAGGGRTRCTPPGAPSSGAQDTTPTPTGRKELHPAGVPACGGSAHLLVEAQAQREAPAVRLIPMLSAQQVLVEMRQGQARPEVRAQHADGRQHDGGVGHGACGGTGSVRTRLPPARPPGRAPPLRRPDRVLLMAPGPSHTLPRALGGAGCPGPPNLGASPLRVTVLMHCLLWMSQRRTVSSWEPESRTLPSVDTDRQVTWFLGRTSPG